MIDGKMTLEEKRKIGFLQLIHNIRKRRLKNEC